MQRAKASGMEGYVVGQTGWTGTGIRNHQSAVTPLAESAFSHPRVAPKPPAISSFAAKTTSFFRRPIPYHSPSTTSLNSHHSVVSARSATAYSPTTSTTNTTANDNPPIHPYSSMGPAPLPVVSSRDAFDDDDECPVCIEPLSFSFRLPGEKPHVVPECGHALHEACFTAVYGPLPSPNRSGVVARKSNLGVCGVCRRPMKVGDGDSGKSNKLAALTGMGDPNSSGLFPGRETPQSHMRRPQATPQPKPYDPSEDDPIEHNGSVRSGGSGEHASYIIAPSIQVRPEFSTLKRTHDPSQPLTCIVVIELPSRRASGHVPGPVMQDVYRKGSIMSNGPGSRQAHSERSESTIRSRQQSIAHSNARSPSPQPEIRRALSPGIRSENGGGGDTHSTNGDSPFKSITDDLLARIIDWKGHHLSGMGPLQMYDVLCVRRDALVREFFVYLFREAIICVEEEKKRTFGRLLQNGAAGAFSDSSSIGGNGKGVLKLKGRIYIRHIKQVTDTSIAGELSLTIDMEDERLESFILIFRDRSSLEAWKTNISSFVAMHQQQGQAQAQIAARMGSTSRDVNGGGGPSSGNRSTGIDGGGVGMGMGTLPDLDEFGAPAPQQQQQGQRPPRIMSGSSSNTYSSTEQDSLLSGSARSSSTSHGSMASPRSGMQQKLTTLGEDEELYMPYAQATPGLVTPHLSSGPSNSLTPLPHSSMDLILVISLPPPNATPSTAALKIRVIKTTLDFVIGSLSAKDRLSLVTFEVGMGGRVRKTPFLCLGRAQSRARLVKFIDEIGNGSVGGGANGGGVSGAEDEFLQRTPKDEKTDVVTAVNHGLDVVLQRKSRNPVPGMLLVSDASDTTRRAQMDLVLARAEAANLPIHSMGYGRSHDPASLWLMSNHTGGTYTFVKDWYDLRDCVAGCIGGMMSIGILHMKLHLKVVDGHRFRIRKVSGGPAAIVASDGRDVDIDVGEVRYGEKKEMLVELELDNSDVHRVRSGMDSGMNGLGALGALSGIGGGGGGGHGNRAMNATDQFVAQMGLDALSLEDSNDFASGMMDRMIDEVPVFEVDGSFYDPAALRQVSRLAHPVLLTVTLLPASDNALKAIPPPAGGSDPVIVRRRMELLASDMITRSLVLISKKNYQQAQKIMSETQRILHTVLQSISQTLPQHFTNGGNNGGSPNGSGTVGSVRNTRKELLTLSAVRALQAILQDMQSLYEALEDSVELFAHDQRNFGAQQAMILRDQKSWSGRTPTEKLFWTTDNSIELVSRSTDWVARD